MLHSNTYTMENWKLKLRRTNVIQTEFGILPICHITFGNYYVQAADRKQFARTVEPVKLTIEVIQQNFSGTDYDPISEEITIDDECYEWSKKHNALFYTAGEGWKISQSLTTAHDLQNWHWELTGRVLEYKPMNMVTWKNN